MPEGERPDEDRLDALEDAKDSLFRRLDAGLVTAVAAVVVSLLALLTSFSQMRAYKATQKASVVPILDVDLGYVERVGPGDDRPRTYFEVRLHNVGAGIAHVQRIRPTRAGEPVADFQSFEDLTMNRRMRGWATLTDAPGAGYIRAGESRSPHSMRIGGGEGDVAPYLRGDYGPPFEGLDVEVCYCSVFDDCWQTSWRRTAAPEPVRACIAGETPVDAFADYEAQRVAARSGGTE